MLDVKVGSGAFMKTPERARELAETMVRIGSAHGLATTALLTDMSVPLGRAVGNALEVAESVEVLRGGGPADVVELTVALAREMLALAGITDVDPAQVLASGAAYPVWERMIAAQGGDPAAPLPVAAPRGDGRRRPLRGAHPAATRSPSAWPRGGSGPAGLARRTRCRPPPACGSWSDVGDAVEAGQPLLELHTDTPEAVAGARAALDGGVLVSDELVSRPRCWRTRSAPEGRTPAGDPPAT